MTRQSPREFEEFGKPISPFGGDSPTITTDDERLLREAFAVNPKQGCSLLFSRYYDNLCSHAIRFVHSKEVAEDIVSEMFASFWQDGVFEHINSSYRAYLYKAVRHRSYNYLKWKVQQTDSLDTISLTTASKSVHPDDALLYSELHIKVEMIIQQLPPQCRRAYILKRVEGMKYDEIASELKISIKAVEALVSRALLRLRTDLKDNWFLSLLLVPIF
ncbi:RNA polymerase sigma-70 factor (ECF subfamily) [Dyadobacter jejuensis]|uniref:RNA polymerase sigma-70 factor (ECF subfamily) n=1 Tax=Dyadobacter jejuensis TaxID=1082580 RepID=A0A316AMW4_9BACT|nr:RNA polymerase sigma-70 factor [Dyadobacter jejuensis]PWJ58649.1 RNA polymerase sigma-70 factor (ECF subfamily) [Dyadobacter jejuensis]